MGQWIRKKEWVRQRIVTNLDWNHDVFWDRDSIAYGKSIDGVIAQALTKRPILILCLCDQDYEALEMLLNAADTDVEVA